jgi:predicted NUDIX family NTP pyrophosphohydrolase
MEWPPKSGQMGEFPEVDAASWFTAEIALTKILKGQKGFIDLLAEKLKYSYSSADVPVGNDEPDNKQKSLFD